MSAPLKRSYITDLSQPETQRESTFGDWFGRWRRPIRSWLQTRAAVAPGEVDDLAQEVFLRLLRYNDELAVSNPQGYLFRIAANVASEWRERARVNQPHDQSWLESLQVESRNEPQNELAELRTSEYVQAAVNKLPPRQRELLLLHVNDGLTYKQIARQRSLTYRVVLRDLTRAYATLRMQLKVEAL